ETELALDNFKYEKATKTITYTFTPIEQTDASQSVVVGVEYKGATKKADAFTIDAKSISARTLKTSLTDVARSVINLLKINE
ncbi:hypothetical protein ABRY18_17925, partial [Clostridioides difficile]